MPNFRESYGLSGPKRRISDPLSPDVLQIVREHYPNAQPEGSVVHWAWSEDWNSRDAEGMATVVAEAWPVRGRAGEWWLRIQFYRPMIFTADALSYKFSPEGTIEAFDVALEEQLEV